MFRLHFFQYPRLSEIIIINLAFKFYIFDSLKVLFQYWIMCLRRITILPSSYLSSCRLAIFQLLDDTEDMAPCLAFFSFVMGCANVPLNIFLIAGALCRKSCLIMPWLVITLLEHLLCGVPLIVFMGLISLYLAAQLHLYIQATVLIGAIVTLFFLSLSSWVSLYL